MQFLMHHIQGQQPYNIPMVKRITEDEDEDVKEMCNFLLSGILEIELVTSSSQKYYISFPAVVAVDDVRCSLYPNSHPFV